MKKIIFDTEAAQAFVEPDKNLLSLVWKRIVSSEEYRDSFSRVSDYIVQNKIKKILADTRLEGTIHPDDRKWLETEIIPKAVKGGLKYTATILDKNIFKKYYLSNLKNSSEGSGMKSFQIFDDYEKGRQWILDKEI